MTFGSNFGRIVKLTAPVVLAFAGLAAIEVSYFPGRDSRLHVAALRAKAVALAELTANSVAPALEFEDEAVLGEFLGSVARDQDVAKVAACSAGGSLLHVVGGGDFVPRCRLVATTRVDMNASELWVTTPILAKTHPGTLLIAFRMDAITRARRDAERVALAIGAGIMLLGMGLSWWIARMLSRLQRLVEENRAARARAEAASEAKSAFLANMSHEIRTPMNGVIGVTQLLERSALDDKQRRHVQTIARSGELLLAIINDILDFSKVEAGHLRIVATTVDLRQLVSEVCDSIRGAAAAKQLLLESEVDSAVPRLVTGDNLRLRQILLNLLSNAVKFTERGAVHLRLCKASNDSAKLRFEVKDNGIGIDPANHAGLFDAFTQIEQHSTRRYGGTGLGLAICKQLVTLMQGTLGVDSSLGTGSTFWVELPLPELAPAEATINTSSMEPAALGPALGASRLLAVDDNEINRGVMQHLAQTLGYEVDLVEGGGEAVQRVTGGGAYGLVLMDCQMPEVDGYMATRQIRAWEQRTNAPRTPIVAVTAHVLDGEEAKVLAAGMDGYLPKPVRLETLQKVVERLGRGTTSPAADASR